MQSAVSDFEIFCRVEVTCKSYDRAACKCVRQQGIGALTEIRTRDPVRVPAHGTRQEKPERGGWWHEPPEAHATSRKQCVI
jgi:hypothetical protein